MNKILTITAILTAVIFASGALASVPTNPPSGATGSVILSVSHQVTNDEDSGLFGYWALDSYTKTITVWKDTAYLPATPWYDAYVSYTGTFCTFTGAKSPMLGTPEPNDGCGTSIGGYDASFKSALGLKAGVITATSYDYGGTKADVLLGTFPGKVTYNWLLAYFPDNTEFDYQDSGKAWSWKYTFANGQTWVNDGSGNSGDIVTTPGTNTGHETVICTDSSTCASGQTCVSGSCTAMVCGITASNTNNGGIYFPNMVPGSGWTQSGDYTTVANTGNIIETPTISGANWVGNTYPGNTNAWMPAAQTAWTITPWTSFGYLGSPAPITALSPSGVTNVYYELNVPLNTPTDVYTQTITFGASC